MRENERKDRAGLQRAIHQGTARRINRVYRAKNQCLKSDSSSDALTSALPGNAAECDEKTLKR
jgi:hypothetical protein